MRAQIVAEPKDVELVEEEVPEIPDEPYQRYVQHDFTEFRCDYYAATKSVTFKLAKRA